jgi:ribonuclease BN (tRNA processing enzyme)
MSKQIKLTILGSGTMPPTKERNPSGFLVEIDKKYFLLDAGHGTMRRLTDYGYNIQDIDLLFISHFHTDHFGDAFNLIHSRWVDDNYNRRLHKSLVVMGPEGIEKRFKLWREIFWVEPNEYYPVKFLEGPRKKKIGDISLEIFPVSHVRWFQSVGIIIKYKKKKIVYTGDIGSDHDFNKLIKVCRNADLLITEASYKEPTPNHYTIKQVESLARKAKIKKVLVVHLRPQHLNVVEEACQGIRSLF